MNIVAIVPARGGSKGVPGKNLRLLGGYPLLAYSVAAARLTSRIRRIIVSTDAETIATIAREYGAEVPFLRPPELARDNSTDLDFMLHAIYWFQRQEGAVPDYLVHLRPTTPLREPQRIAAAIDVLRDRPEATSLRSAHPAPESPFKWFRRDSAGYFRGLFDGVSNETLNNPRQTFPEAFIPDGYVDVVKPAAILASGLLHGERMVGFESPRCTEVDTVADLELLEWELRQRGSALWDFLIANYPKRG